MTGKCRHCGKKVTSSHYCSSARRTVPTPTTTNDGDFFTSMMIGMATDNAIIGGVLGGNMAGGIVGDAMNSSGGFFGASDSSSSYDSGSSSCDSGSSGGGCE